MDPTDLRNQSLDRFGMAIQELCSSYIKYHHNTLEEVEEVVEEEEVEEEVEEVVVEEVEVVEEEE